MESAPLSILVVDDMRTIFVVVERILAPLQYKVFHEPRPEKCVEVAAALQPSAILLDFEMPVLSGPDACRALKADPRTAAIPVVFLTSHAGDREIGEAFMAGADDYVVKPPRERELIARLSRIALNHELNLRLQVKQDEQAHVVRIVSHDINNLLHLVTAGIDGMAKAAGTGEAGFHREYQRALGGAERIRELIGNVQELQAFEDSKLAVALSPVELRGIFDSCGQVFADKVAAKGVSLEIDCPVGILVQAEPVALANSVVNNLISNAIKFSFRGGVISVSASREGSRVNVAIEDRGIGMNAELCGKIFSRSEKTSRPGTDQEKGIGFGMPIVKQYMEAFGGSVVVESRSREENPKSGTTVRLTFQAAEPA